MGNLSIWGFIGMQTGQEGGIRHCPSFPWPKRFFGQNKEKNKEKNAKFKVHGRKKNLKKLIPMRNHEGVGIKWG